MKKYFYNSLNKKKINKIDHIFKCLIYSFQKAANIPINKNQIIIVKETGLEIYATEIKKLFPSSKFIQLIRDPRDNYSSLKSGSSKHYLKFNEDYIHSLANMINSYGLGLKLSQINQEKFGNKNYMITKYEDICSNPKKN